MRSVNKPKDKRRGLRAPGVRVMAESRNTKLGPIAATYVSQASCPRDCPFYKNGCYAEHPPMAWSMTRVLNRSTVRSPAVLARHEARLVDKLPADRDLRLHVLGDTRTVGAAQRLGAAARRYIARGAAKGRAVRVFSYTHGWRSVPRSAWGPVSVLASCETAAQAKTAMARGYAAALVVPVFPGKAVYTDGGVRVVPCPAQTAGTTCSACRLCGNADRLLAAGLVIGFAVHGTQRKAVAETLRRLSLPVV